MDLKVKPGLWTIVVHMFIRLCAATDLFSVITEGSDPKDQVVGVMWRGWWWESEAVKAERHLNNIAFTRQHLGIYEDEMGIEEVSR